MCGEREPTKRYVRLVIIFPLILLCCYFIDLSGNKIVPNNTDTHNICSLCIKIKHFLEQQNGFETELINFNGSRFSVVLILKWPNTMTK